jgi:hypothetical protein
LRGAAVP